MYKIEKINLDKGTTKELYTYYFYKKGVSNVYEVTTNGDSCTASVYKDAEIDSRFNWGTSLPKYIIKNLEL